MIEIKTKYGDVFVLKSSNLEGDEILLFNEITSRFSDKNTRAIPVELNTNFHTEKSTTILCEEIEKIIRR